MQPIRADFRFKLGDISSLAHAIESVMKSKPDSDVLLSSRSVSTREFGSEDCFAVSKFCRNRKLKRACSFCLCCRMRLRKELLTLTLMRDLRARGHSVMCVNSSWGDPEFGKLLDKEQIANVSAPLGFISRSLAWPAFVMTLDQLRKLPSLWLCYRKTLKQFKPQVVVHSNFPSSPDALADA